MLRQGTEDDAKMDSYSQRHAQDAHGLLTFVNYVNSSTEGYSTAGVLPGGLSDLNTPEHSKGFCKV